MRLGYRQAMNPSCSTAPARRLGARLAIVLQAGLAAVAGIADAQQIRVDPPTPVLAGDIRAITIEGLRPGAAVELHARRPVRDFSGTRLYASQARWQAGADGRVDLARDAPLPGSSWQGADLRGAFWSMTPSGPAPEGGSTAEAELEVRVGDGPPVRQRLRLLAALPEVTRRAAAGFDGAVFATLPAATPRPGLILLGGSEGGSQITRDAPAYASRGYAVLALPYYSPPGWGPAGPTPAELPGLPAAFADIPLERLQQARDWLARQPEVDPARIGVVGTSKGAEFALLAATRMPWVRSVVAWVPSDVVWEGWGPGTEPGRSSSFSWQGKPLPFVPYRGMAEELAGFQTGAAVRLRRPQDAGRAAHPERIAAARIPVEDFAGPLMVIGGHADQVWDSGGMAEQIADRRRQAGRETVARVFRDAGHYLGSHGWGPTTQYDAGPMKGGGTPQANAHAQAESWRALFDFLARTLGPLPPR